MDYEEKYNAALSRASKLIVQNPFDTVGQMVEHIFPELKEPEDDSIKKDLMGWFEEFPDMIWRGHYKKDVLAWIEKQGEQKPYGQRKECEDCQFNYVGECKGYCALKRNEHKPTDKVEPKFNVGDCVISNDGTHTYLVKERKRGIYVLLDIGDGVEFNIVIETADKTGRLWSIYDAKDGDVLSGEIDGDKYIFSFKKLNGRWIETQGVCYCETTGECIEDARFCNHYQDFFKPASKEECDVLLLKTVNHQLK